MTLEQRLSMIRSNVERLERRPAPVVTFNTQAGTSYILTINDANKTVETNSASVNTVTVPPNVDVGFPIGTRVGVAQYGAGATTIVAGVGVTLRGTLTVGAQYGVVSIVQRAANEWYVFGGA